VTITEMKSTLVRGTLGNGGIELRISTSNGNIDLFKLS
jgi:hypothetical protein